MKKEEITIDNTKEEIFEELELVRECLKEAEQERKEAEEEKESMERDFELQIEEMESDWVKLNNKTDDLNLPVIKSMGDADKLKRIVGLFHSITESQLRQLENQETAFTN